MLTPWPLWDAAVTLKEPNNFQTHVKDRYLEHFMLNCPEKSTRPALIIVNIGSDNGVIPSGNKPVPEPVLTRIYAALWRH